MIIERTTVQVSDDTGRIAMLEMRTEGNASDDHGTAEELTRYIYSNHLQSASLELDETGEVISYEEYHPYGTTSYQAMNASIHAVAKRYRYTGKERDEESGLYYHGARYYVPWLGRWTAVDPLENEYAGMSPYNYGFNNPVIFNDPSGADPGDGDDPKSKVERESGPYPSNQVDNARDVRGEGAIRLLQKQEATATNQAKAKHAQMLHNMRLDQRYIGEDQKGNFYNTSRRDIALQKYMMNEAWGEAIWGGPVAALGSLLDGREGAMKGSVVDAVMMSFSSPGTPYGKLGTSKPIEIKSVPIIEAPLQQARFSNKYVRTWYDIKVNSLNTSVPFTEKNAKYLTEQRNALKIEARAMMMDREAAAKLGISNPIRPLGFYIKKYSEKGYSGEGLWQRIIQGSATPNKKINNEQGVKIYYYGK